VGDAESYIDAVTRSSRRGLAGVFLFHEIDVRGLPKRLDSIAS